MAIPEAVAEQLDLVHVHAAAKYTFQNAWSARDERGRQTSLDKGIVFKFLPQDAAWEDEFGEMHRGVRFRELSANARARKFCAMGKISLERERERTGVPAATILEFFLDKHGDKRGVEWNIADVEGKAVDPRALQFNAPEARILDAAEREPNEFIIRNPVEGNWWCALCETRAGGPQGQGWPFHKKKKEHKRNLAKWDEAHESEPAAAASP